MSAGAIPAMLERLDALGAARPDGMTAAAFRRGREEMAARLAYLDAGAVGELAEHIASRIVELGRWPAPAVVLHMAHRHWPNAAVDAEREAGIARWMRSAPGREAEAGDYAVEMLAHFRRVGPGSAIGKVYTERWRSAASERRRARARAVEDGDDAVIRRIDARVAEAAALSEGANS